MIDGYVKVAAATPRVKVADVNFNTSVDFPSVVIDEFLLVGDVKLLFRIISLY